MQSEINTYAGLFWGAVVQDTVRELFLDFLCGAGTAPLLSRLPYQTWRLESGELCIGLPLAEFPPIPNGLVASSKVTRSVPACWIADKHLVEVRRDFLALQKVAAQHGFLLPQGETLLVSPIRVAESGVGTHGEGVEAREGILLECLEAFEESDLSMMAVRVPDAWGLVSPYWTPGQLIEFLTSDEVYIQDTTVPLEGVGLAPARIVLVQDHVRGVFAEIHCKRGEGGGALDLLRVVDVLANAEVREWMHSQRTSRWLEMTLAVVTRGLLNW